MHARCIDSKARSIAALFKLAHYPLFGSIDAAYAQENRVTAIDILLEPDATMVQHAQADNARLLKAYPTGFALDPTHQPHLTLIYQFVRTADLEMIYGAANQVLAQENVASWNLKAVRYYYIPVPPNGIAGIVVEPTEELLRLQRRLLDAVAPFTEKTGTAAAFQLPAVIPRFRPMDIMARQSSAWCTLTRLRRSGCRALLRQPSSWRAAGRELQRRDPAAGRSMKYPTLRGESAGRSGKILREGA
jgi:hypothetical protein